MRGLGSTSVSRSLVVFDEVPLNDPYGGWIHWEELPELDIQSVEVVRGGASDLYGSSAIGGVISVEPVRPKNSIFQLSTSGGSESTVDGALLGSLTLGKWSGLVTGGAVATDGYILTAPEYRGPIDQPSNVHAQNALVQLDRDLGNSQRVFLRGNALAEARHNGTPHTKQWNPPLAVRCGGRSDRLTSCVSMAPPSTIGRDFPRSTHTHRGDADHQRRRTFQ